MQMKRFASDRARSDGQLLLLPSRAHPRDMRRMRFDESLDRRLIGETTPSRSIFPPRSTMQLPLLQRYVQSNIFFCSSHYRGPHREPDSRSRSMAQLGITPCVKTLRGITAPGFLGPTVMRRAKKRKNLSSARHYDQIRFRFHTAKTQHRHSRGTTNSAGFRQRCLSPKVPASLQRSRAGRAKSFAASCATDLGLAPAAPRSRVEKFRHQRLEDIEAFDLRHMTAIFDDFDS